MDEIDKLINNIEKTGFFIKKIYNPTPQQKARDKWHQKLRKRRVANKARVPLTKEGKAAKALYDATRGATILGMWKEMRKACNSKRKYAESRGNLETATRWVWGISEVDWTWMWLSCDSVLDERTGKTIPAWRKRGKDKNKDVQLNRIDKAKPWTIDNVSVMYLGRKLYDGREHGLTL